MTPEQAAALIVAITGLVGALGAVFVQLRQTHSLINSRMTELVETTKLAAQARGELAGRDFAAGATAGGSLAPKHDGKPTGR